MATKLLLIDDVENLGRSGELVLVRPGYARNYLLPQGYAVVASAATLRMQEKLKEERKQKAILDKQESDTIASQLTGVVLTTVVKVDQEGHMYGSVSVVDIAKLIEDQQGLVIEKRNIILKHALKETGIHEISVKLKEGVTAIFTLKILSEEEHRLASQQVES